MNNPTTTPHPPARPEDVARFMRVMNDAESAMGRATVAYIESVERQNAELTKRCEESNKHVIAVSTAKDAEIARLRDVDSLLAENYNAMVVRAEANSARYQKAEADCERLARENENLVGMYRSLTDRHFAALARAEKAEAEVREAFQAGQEKWFDHVHLAWHDKYSTLEDWQNSRERAGKGDK